MTLAIIQCRLGSTRFPRKALAKMNDGRPVIAHVVERAQQIRSVDLVVVTTPASDGDEIFKVCGTSVHQWGGNPSDVLGRFAHVAEQHDNAYTIMRLTGDTPLLQPTVCERVLGLYRSTPNCEYAWTDTHSGEWFDGTDCEVFSRDLLMRADALATHPDDREHVTPWMRRNAKVMASLPPDPRYQGWPKLSIDTPKDLERVRNWKRPIARSISYSRSQ